MIELLADGIHLTESVHWADVVTGALFAGFAAFVVWMIRTAKRYG